MLKHSMAFETIPDLVSGGVNGMLSTNCREITVMCLSLWQHPLVSKHLAFLFIY